MIQNKLTATPSASCHNDNCVYGIVQYSNSDLATKVFCTCWTFLLKSKLGKMAFPLRALIIFGTALVTSSTAAEETCAKSDPGCDASKHHDKYSEDANMGTFEVGVLL